MSWDHVTCRWDTEQQRLGRRSSSTSCASLGHRAETKLPLLQEGGRQPVPGLPPCTFSQGGWLGCGSQNLGCFLVINPAQKTTLTSGISNVKSQGWALKGSRAHRISPGTQHAGQAASIHSKAGCWSTGRREPASPSHLFGFYILPTWWQGPCHFCTFPGQFCPSSKRQVPVHLGYTQGHNIYDLLTQITAARISCSWRMEVQKHRWVSRRHQQFTVKSRGVGSPAAREKQEEGYSQGTNTQCSHTDPMPWASFCTTRLGHCDWWSDPVWQATPSSQLRPLANSFLTQNALVLWSKDTNITFEPFWLISKLQDWPKSNLNHPKEH